MQRKVVVMSDRACDLSSELIKEYNIQLIPFYITINKKGYVGDVEITPTKIFEIFKKTGDLPKTAIMSVGEYIDFFKQWIDNGYDVVHISIGSKLSGAHQNALMAQNEIGDHLYIVDSKNMSTGMGLLVLEAAQRAQNGMIAEQIANEVRALIDQVRTSFILEDLKFLKAGGRCSAATAFGANLLMIKPSIAVHDGVMGIDKKYRGHWEKVILQYSRDTLDVYHDIKKDRVFITHSGVPQEISDSVFKFIKSKRIFNEIFVTNTGSTTSSHAGPNVIGVVFMAK